ncbi:MAG TPA: CGNR zinc finger domain-containing protein [Mycobacteriales bacterium]
MTEPAAPVDLAVALVNTWDLIADPHELLPDDATAQRFLLRHGYPQDAAALEGAQQLRTARDRLRAVIHAADQPTAAELLNRLLLDSRAVPRLTAGGSGWRLDAGPERPGVERVLARAATGLAVFIAERGFDRLGTCAAAPCDCAFLDRTRAGTRRYCCTYCADRVAASAYRRRRRAGAEPS